MQVIDFATRSRTLQPQAQHEAAQAFVGTALVVLFADGAELERVRREGGGPIALCPPFHVGEDDAYLVLPDDIGAEIVDILHDADCDLLHEALRDGVLVTGQIGKNPAGRGMALDATQVCSALTLLTSDAPYAAELSLGGSGNILRTLNTLPHVQCTTLSALVDDEGLEAVLSEPEFLGTSWRAPATAKGLQDIEPTHLWSRRRGEAGVGIELALFQEDDELIAVLRPALLRP